MPFYDLILNGVMFPQIKSKIVSWHPDVATQLCLSSEDDHTPVIQLWDLRYATSPVKQLENHTRYLSFFKILNLYNMSTRIIECLCTMHVLRCICKMNLML